MTDNSELLIISQTVVLARIQIRHSFPFSKISPVLSKYITNTWTWAGPLSRIFWSIINKILVHYGDVGRGTRNII